MNPVYFFDKLNKISLYLVLFLIPVFFLPLTQNVLDFPKQILASFLILLSLIGWLGKSIFEGSLVLRGNKFLYLSLFLILFSLLLSSAFSLAPRISFFGSPSVVTDSFLTFVLFLIFAFIVINSFKKASELFPFLFFFLLSGGIAGILNILQVYRIFVFPFDFARNASFNTVGTTYSLAVFSAALLPLSLVLAFNSKGFLKKFLGVISLVFLINLVLINFKTAWIVLMIGILVLFVFGFANQKNKIRASWAVLLMAGLVISIFFYFFPVRLPGFPVFPPEVSLNLPSEVNILQGAFGENTKNAVLGTGPGTFIFNYSKHRSPLLNQTLFWGTRFSEGSSSFLDWVLTKGILGAVTLLYLFFLIIYSIFKGLEKLETNSFFEVKLGLAAGILGLICASFFYNLNFVLNFAFWFLIASFLLFFSLELKKINLSSHLRMIAANLVLVAVIILSLSLFIFQGQTYFAEANYLKGIESSQAGDVDKAIGKIQQAASLNAHSDSYWRELSQLYLAKTNLIVQDDALSAEERRRQVNLAIIDGAEAINQAISVAPMNVANWNVRGFFYRNLIGIEGAADLSLASYQRASQLEPSSPFAFGEKGRIYILKAQDFAQRGQEALKIENLDAAIDSLKIAIGLKTDYAPAHYLLAVAHDQKGELDQAILKLEETKTIIPQDAGVAFQLGLLYWRKDQLDQAQEELERAVSLDPDYSNARYMLGLVYDERGEKNKAKEEIEIVARLNPGNQEIRKVLENIEKGLPALEDITLSQPPIEMTPPEIQQ